MDELKLTRDSAASIEIVFMSCFCTKVNDEERIDKLTVVNGGSRLPIGIVVRSPFLIPTKNTPSTTSILPC